VPAPEPLEGWAWLEAPADSGAPAADLCRAATACFATPDGRLLVRHLRRVFLDRRLPATASDAELRHLEGQRSAVAHLLQLAERGRGPAPRQEPTLPDPREPR
jgi:hypothetical protein